MADNRVHGYRSPSTDDQGRSPKRQRLGIPNSSNRNNSDNNSANESDSNSTRTQEEWQALRSEFRGKLNQLEATTANKYHDSQMKTERAFEKEKNQLRKQVDLDNKIIRQLREDLERERSDHQESIRKLQEGLETERRNAREELETERRNAREELETERRNAQEELETERRNVQEAHAARAAAERKHRHRKALMKRHCNEMMVDSSSDADEAGETSSIASDEDYSSSHDQSDDNEESVMPENEEQQDHDSRIWIGDKYRFLVSGSQFLEIDWDKEYRREGESKWVCTTCSHELKSDLGIEDHVWIKHYKGYFQCPHCSDPPVYFSWRAGARRHMRSKHP